MTDSWVGRSGRAPSTNPRSPRTSGASSKGVNSATPSGLYSREKTASRRGPLTRCPYACLTHVGVEAQRAQGRNKNKTVLRPAAADLRLPPIRQFKADLRRAVWNEAVREVPKVSHERTVIRRLEKLLAA